MKALRTLRATYQTALRLKPTNDRLIIVLGVLLSLLMLLTLGCSVVQDLASTTTVITSGSTTSTTAGRTTSTLSDVTSSTTPQTTATVASTSTTLPQATTTTVTVGAPTTGIPSVSQQPAGTVLYEITDWSSGTSGWAAAGQWKAAGGMLVTDGSSDSFAVAPVDLTGHPDYVVECEVQIVDPEAKTDVLLMARMINGTGYYGGFDGSASRMATGYGSGELSSSGFVLDGNWHTYRLEVRGNTIKLLFEQAEVARAVDNRALEPGTVGIYCAGGQICVRSFRVVAL
jgi:hypothetical protein